METSSIIKILVVDDSALMRKKIIQMLESDRELKVIGTARDGEDAIIKAKDLQPDVITMDVNMPQMDGLTALQHIISENICPVIMLSSLTQDGALVTYEAIELGAFDFVPKPGGTISLGIEEIQKELIAKIKFAAKTGSLKKIRSYRERKRVLMNEANVKRDTKSSFPINTDASIAVAIGVSTGGPRVLSEIIAMLPANLNAAVFIVQHIPANFTSSFANRLNTIAQMQVKEAEAGEIIKNSTIYLGKGGYHLLIKRMGNTPIRVRLANRPHALFIPSVDIMMESVLETFGKRTIGVLLTGMGDDGANAMVKIKRAGGITIAESEETAVVFGMPAEAISRGGADIVAPSYKIAENIIRAVNSLC